MSKLNIEQTEETIINGKIFRSIEKIYDGNHAHGKTTVIIKCPFCGAEVEAYTWSLHGSGKKCYCGAILGTFSAYKRPNNSKKEK